MNTLKIGWTSELTVAADLTKRGFDVYLGFAGKWDMLAIKQDLLFRVEVKTSSTMRRDWHRIKYKPDLLALVSRAGQIAYTSYASLLVDKDFENRP